MKKGWLKSYAQDGKKVAALSPEDAAIATVLMERNRGKNFVDRAFNNETAPRLQTNTIPGYETISPQMYSTELMAYDVNPDGTARVYPEIVQKPGEKNLTYLGGDRAWNYADSTGEYIATPNAKIADMLSDKGYKKAAGIPTYAGGGMIKRADGSYSKRGLWDNIRANAGSGKKPTKEMLKQEKKIRAAEKKAQSGIYMPVANASTPFMPNVANTAVVQQAPSFLTGVPNGFDMNTKLGYMQYLQDSIANESRKRIIDKPYNQNDPTITLNTGNFRNAKVNTKVIDDAIASAKKKGIPVWQMIGMAGQETVLGSNRKERDSGYERPNTQRNIVSGWNTTEPVLPEDFEVYMAGHGVPGVKAIRTDKRYIGTVTDPDAAEKYLQKHPRVIDSYRKSQSLKVPKKSMSEFDYAASFLKEKGIKNYNPGEKAYSSEVNQRIKELSSDPVFMNYVKQKGYNLGTPRQYKNGGNINKNWLQNY